MEDGFTHKFCGRPKKIKAAWPGLDYATPKGAACLARIFHQFGEICGLELRPAAPSIPLQQVQR